MTGAKKITVEVEVKAPVEKAWDLFNGPEHIVQWSNASADWHTPRATNDLKTGGTFSYRMEARDGSSGFDFNGTYDEVVPHERIAYTMEDGRMAEILFMKTDGGTRVTETFEMETKNSEELQRSGWQAILDSFKKYAEA